MSDTKPDDYAALCERLRAAWNSPSLSGATRKQLCTQAADAIERQAAEIAQLERELDAAKDPITFAQTALAAISKEKHK